jgi:hypothetical protein
MEQQTMPAIKVLAAVEQDLFTAQAVTAVKQDNLIIQCTVQAVAVLEDLVDFILLLLITHMLLEEAVYKTAGLKLILVVAEEVQLVQPVALMAVVQAVDSRLIFYKLAI